MNKRSANGQLYQTETSDQERRVLVQQAAGAVGYEKAAAVDAFASMRSAAD